MENICLHLNYGIYVIFVTFLYFGSGYDDFLVEVPWKELKKYETAPVAVCPCKPCMTGPKCQDKVSTMNPRFSQRYYYIELSEEYKPGTPIPYNSTTYPGGKECSCGDFEYRITDVRNAMEDRDGALEDAVFSIDKNTGEISINRNLKAFEFYKMTIKVRNEITNETDEARISVALEPPTRRTNRYSPEIFNGYEIDIEEDEFSYSPHHISKRSVIDPAEVNFTLSVNGDTSAVKVGSKLEFTLDIIFPSAPVDMLVELFTPDNVTTVMILCDVVIASIGSNLSPDVASPTVVMDSKDNSTMYDRAIIDFGTVSNSEADTTNIAASTITITYDAVMVLNGATVNGDTYWVSAGAEYENENKIWVGQASFTADTIDMSVTETATFNVSLPTNMALGSSSLVKVDMFLPYPSSTYIFNVFTPLNASGVMSVCAVMYNDVAQNFGCGNDMTTQVTQSLTPDSTSVGNSQGTVNLGTMLNKGSRVVPYVIADNRVTVYFVLHLYPHDYLIGTTQTVAITLEVDTSTIWVGNTDVIIDAATPSGFTDPVFVNLTTDLTSLTATIGEPFKVLVDISIPAPATPGVATPYVLEVLAPFSTTAIFKLCSLEIVYVGRDLPCVNKDELVAEYHSSASPAGDLADRATLDLGYVMNIDHYKGVGDDIIQIQAIFSPNSDHPSATDGSSHTITFGATVGTTSPTSVSLATESISLSGTATVTPISNATAPSFTMSYYDSVSNAQAEEISVLESTKVLVDMVTTRNVMYDKMDMEWLMQLATDSPYMHLCKAEVVSTGKNLPCLTPEWTNKLIQYESQFGNAYIDRGSMYVGSLCNKEMVNDVAQDKATFAIYLKLLNLPTIADMDEFWVSMGLMYSSSQLWVGQLKLVARLGESITPVTNPQVSLSKNSTLTDIPLGYYAVYSLLLKIPPGDRTDLEITATVDKAGLDVCSMRVAYVGANLPCVTDNLATKTYIPQSATLDLDIVTNFGSGSLNTEAIFDDDSIIVEILLKSNAAVAADTYQLDVTSYYDTGKTVSHTMTETGITTTGSLTGINTTVSTAVAGTLSVGEIAGNDTDANIAVGETKRILCSLVIPDESIYDLKVSVTIPAADVGKLEIGDAAIFSAGENLPCIDTNLAPTITSVGGVFNDNAEFTLGYVCNRPVKPGDAAANTLTIEVWVRLLPNALGLAAVGSTVTIASSVVTFGGTSVTVGTLGLTATDAATFTDKVRSLTGVTNSTLISINVASPFPMTVGENKTIDVTVTVPPYSVSRFLFDVDLPYDAQSACMTVSDITVTSTIGANIPCFAPDTNKGISYTPTYTSALGTTQMTNGYQDLGIIANTGKTHRLGTNATGDDNIVLQITIQMADCAGSADGSTHILSLGDKIAGIIMIYDNDVTVSRNTLEKPDFTLLLTSNVVSSSLINIDGEFYHSAASTAEGHNTSIVIASPEYLIAPATLVTASLSSYSIISDPAAPYRLEIFFNNFFFTDYFTFRAAISVNTSAYIQSDKTIIYSSVGTDFVPRNSNYSAEEWYPYHVSDGATLNVNLDPSSGDGCTIVSLTLGNNAIQSCQVGGSPDFLPSFEPRYGIKNSGSAWKPGIRDGTLARKKYFQVYFGNVVQIYQIEILQTVAVDLATELLIDYSNDGEAWFDPETINLGPTPSTSETVVLQSVVEARYARIKITNDTKNLIKAEPALNFEFYGCVVSSDVSDPCASIPSTVPRPTGFYTRSFIEDPVNSYVFVCDEDVTSSSDEGRCHKSTDGISWTDLDERIGSLIGFEQNEGRLYGYDNNKETILVSADYGATWYAADGNELASDKLQSWTDAKEVPLDTSLDLDLATPSGAYTFNAWGATYTGLHKNNVLEQKWSSL